jgi:cell wall-associated NlpC family hydrolase
VALAALGELGAPYAYGGSGPRTFDCSGLVQYSYAQAGVHVPRTAKEQFEASRPVPASGMRAGDAVFFRSGWFRHWHVGIYLGDGRFVHAPSGRGTVSIAVLSDPYWSRRFVRAGRFPR